jgi:hypothetical protein
MSLHIKEQKAHEEASRLELEHQRKARSGRHSSGHKYVRYGVRRAFFVLWEVYEHYPTQRPRVRDDV